MSTPTKTVLSPDPHVLQALAAGANLLGAELAFTTKFAGAIAFDFAPVAATAAAAATMMQLLAAMKDGAAIADDAWEVIQEWLSPTSTASQISTTVNGTAGQTSLTLTAGTITTFFQDYFIKGGTTDEAGSEWIYPLSQSGNTVQLRGPLKNSYVNRELWSGALKLRFEQDFSNLRTYKVCIFNGRGATNRNVAVRARILTLDSVG